MWCAVWCRAKPIACASNWSEAFTPVPCRIGCNCQSQQISPVAGAAFFVCVLPKRNYHRRLAFQVVGVCVFTVRSPIQHDSLVSDHADKLLGRRHGTPGKRRPRWCCIRPAAIPAPRRSEPLFSEPNRKGRDGKRRAACSDSVCAERKQRSVG